MNSKLCLERLKHVRRVCRLYKAILRDIQSWGYDLKHRCEYRILSVETRSKFEKNRCLIDKCEIERIVSETEEWLFRTQNPQPFYFVRSPGGVAYKREVVPPDWVLDYWHPLEKAMYPKYFAKREERKKEYVAWYNTKYNIKTEDKK